MSDYDALDERLRAVERALTDGDSDLTDLRNATELTDEVESLAVRLDAVEDRADELDAATQALRGYVGNVRAVNEAVERRADAALAKAESLEAEVAETGRRPETPVGGCECDVRTAEGPALDADSPQKSRDTDDRGLLDRIAEVL